MDKSRNDGVFNPESPFIDLPAKEEEEDVTRYSGEDELTENNPLVLPGEAQEVEGEESTDNETQFEKFIPPLIGMQKLSRWHQVIKNTVPCPAVPLLHGKETYRHMVDAIRTAVDSSHYIYILGWMLDVDFEMIPGDASSKLSVLLKEAAGKKVEIRVLIWDNPLYLNDIKNAADKINALPNSLLLKDNATYGSPGLKRAIFTLKMLLAQLPHFLKYIDSWRNFIDKVNVVQNEGSHHEKVLVVKGKEGLIGFCGGIDINPNRVGGTDNAGRSTVLHDIHCELRGHAAWVLLHRFLWRWQVFRSEKPPVWTPLAFLPLRGESEPVPAPGSPGRTTANVKILQTYNHPGNPAIKDRSIREAVRLAIMNAKKTIHIEDQYMISLEIATWLNRKLSEPGFQSVSILTQDDSIALEDLQFPKSMRKKFIDTLQQNLGPDIIRKKIFIQQLNLLDPPLAHHRVHSKIYIIDDELAIIGSANLSSRSMTHDSETAAVIFNDPGSATDFVAQLRYKENYDPNANILPYNPNPQIKDRDVEIIDDLNHLPLAAKVALSLTGISGSIIIPRIIKLLVTQLKPTIIDIIDPDADNTQPQQEVDERMEAAFEILQSGETDSGEYRNEEESTEINDDHETGYEERDLSFEQMEDLEEEFNKSGETFQQIDDRELAEEIENQVAKVEADSESVKSCETHTCWAKTVLNNLGATLQVTSKLDEDTKKVIIGFQQKYNLPQTARIDAATERALLEAEAIRRNAASLLAPATLALITAAKSKIEDWTSRAINNKPRLILNNYRDPRKIFAFVLHQMAFKRKGRQSRQFSDPTSYLSTGAHFCILFDGRIIQLHPMSRMIWHGNCISPRSVAVEFEGNFPNVKGKWWIDRKSNVQNKDLPTQAQYEAGQFLTSYLKTVLGIRGILAHRQSSGSRENDPGPDIWYHVGQWAMEKLGLSDGGPGFKCGTGNPILPQWRTWSSKNNPVVNPELDESMEEREENDDENEYSTLETSERDMDYEWETEEFLTPDWSRAIRLNRYYAEKIGWDQYYEQINNLLLAATGQEGVSLGEEAFAQAVSVWQNKNGLTGKNADGIIGPATWWKMKTFITSGPESPGQSSPGSPPSGNSAHIPSELTLGILTIDTSVPALSKSYPHYQFTTDDAVWLARFVEGEAGGQDNPDSHSVIWAMFNRFGTVRHRVPSWTTFAVFLQKYSTTLQPFLNSVGAAKRVWDNNKRNPDKYPVEWIDENYPGTNIKKVQYKRHKILQRKKWEAFTSDTRNMVSGIMNGKIPNPGIGIATHFLSTYILMVSSRRNQGITGKPSREEWIQYTLQFAQNKKLIWIGEKPGLNQQKNAFFIQPEFKFVPPDAVKVLSGGGYRS